MAQARMALLRSRPGAVRAAWRRGCRPGLARMLGEGCQLLAEGPGIVRIQVDLILGAADGEPQRLLGWAPVKIVY